MDSNTSSAVVQEPTVEELAVPLIDRPRQDGDAFRDLGTTPSTVIPPVPDIGDLTRQIETLRNELEYTRGLLERSRQAARHNERGLDIMKEWHDRFIATIRQKAQDWRDHEEWCAVYDRAMEDFGITPLPRYELVTFTVTFTGLVSAHRHQRAGDVEYMNRSVSYRAGTRIRDAVMNSYAADPFDDDYTLEPDSLTVEDITVVDSEPSDGDMSEYDPF